MTINIVTPDLLVKGRWADSIIAMEQYSVFGSTISSELALPLAFSESVHASCVIVRRSPVPIPSVTNGHALHSSDGDVVARIEKHGPVLICDFIDYAKFKFDGSTIWFEFLNSDDEIGRSLLMTQILPMVLSINADLLLHASTVTDGFKAWTFVGLEGTGKSTIAAAFFGRKYGVLTDDASTLKMFPGRITVSAGVPEIRLFPETFNKVFPHRSLGETSAVLRKRSLPTGSDSGRSVPLHSLYCLNPSPVSTVSVERIKPATALQLILPNIFRFDLWDRSLRERELLNVTRLLAEIPAFEVNYKFEWHSFANLLDSLETSMKSP